LSSPCPSTSSPRPCSRSPRHPHSSPTRRSSDLADATHLDERGGQEAAQADIEDEATLDDLDDGAGDDAVIEVVKGGLILDIGLRSEEHTSELQSRENLVCRLLLEKKNRPSGRRT